MTIAGSQFWAVVPAAGVSKRFGAALPKQYFSLAGKPVFAHTLERLLAVSELSGIVVAVAADDKRWLNLGYVDHPRIRFVTGGASRSESVALALRALQSQADEHDWVLVHDVARPCVRVADIKQLMDIVSASNVGGLLATAMTDTVKRVAYDTESDKCNVLATEDREQLWRALTPQMFRLGKLQAALASASKAASSQGVEITDESSAIELLGERPLIVKGSADNIKITMREDLAIAETILQQQEREGQ